MTEHQFKLAVLDILRDQAEILQEDPDAITTEQFKQIVLDVVTNHPKTLGVNQKTITPADLETYEDKILDRADKYYKDALARTITGIGIVFAVAIAFVGWLVPSWLERKRKKLFKKEMAEQEFKLQEAAEKKITEATQKLYTETAGNLATVYLGIASSNEDNVYMRLMSAIFAVDQALTGMSVGVAKASLTPILKDVQSLNTTDLNNTEWENIDKYIRMVERNSSLTDYPEISEILVQIGQITSYHIIQLKKETDDPDNK